MNKYQTKVEYNTCSIETEALTAVTTIVMLGVGIYILVRIRGQYNNNNNGSQINNTNATRTNN